MNSMRMKYLLLIALAAALEAQVQEQAVVLTIDIENHVLYRGTVFDATKLAKDSAPTMSVNQAFVDGVSVADIVSINGTPAKGLYQTTVFAMPYRAVPQPGQPIADFDLGGTLFETFHIYLPNGTYLGSLSGTGATPPGGFIVTGGLGGFFGVSGEHRFRALVPNGQASTAEDPANRRNRPGGKAQIVFYLYPKFRPTVQITVAGPSIFHSSDFSPVTQANPARRGEVLILRAMGLGPVRPDLLPPNSVRFSNDPVQEVNSPVDVTINGKTVSAINKIGWPGETDVYRVDFRVPPDAEQGTATLHLTAAWIPGPAVTIPIR